MERRILISLGKVGGVQDGLGEYARQLGQRFAAAAPAWREQHGVQFHFHLLESLFGLFGPEVGYLPVNRWQEWRAAIPGPWDLWHSLHQLNRSKPPAQAALRLVSVHDLSYQYGRNAFSTWRHHRRTRALMSRTDAVVAISRYTADDVRRFLHWTGPLDVILNGARTLVGEPQQALPAWDHQPSKPFLFHLSRMNPSKNPQALIALARYWPEMHFVLCGPANDHSRELSTHTQLPNVEFHLGISDAQKTWAYAHCAGFLFPSLTEGFGLPPIEAMHFGKPCFLARRTCLPEIGGDAADYFDDFNPATMQHVVQRGLSRMTEPGRADAIRQHAAQFNWDRAADEYLSLYERLLKLPTSAPSRRG